MNYQNQEFGDITVNFSNNQDNNGRENFPHMIFKDTFLF